MNNEIANLLLRVDGMLESARYPETGNERCALRTAIDLLQSPSEPPDCDGAEIRIGVVVYDSGGDQYVNTDVIYDDQNEVMEALEMRAGSDPITHQCIVRVLVPAVPETAVPEVDATVEAP